MSDKRKPKHTAKLLPVNWKRIAEDRRKHLDKCSTEAWKLTQDLMKLGARIAALSDDLQKGVY